MNGQRITGTFAGTAAMVLLIGCSDNPQEPDGSDLPAADGAALLNFLAEQDYQDEWALWPGRGRL